jgi:putative FmdB family regulatory protein
MALYEYVCRDCESSFEVRRSMEEADSRVTCPSGHSDVRRKLSMFAAVGTRSAPTASAGPVGAGAGGGCCGGACGCGR